MPSEGIASLFLPKSSIYSSLDDPQESTTSPTHNDRHPQSPQSPLHRQHIRHNHDLGTDSANPFSAVPFDSSNYAHNPSIAESSSSPNRHNRNNNLNYRDSPSVLGILNQSRDNTYEMYRDEPLPEGDEEEEEDLYEQPPPDIIVDHHAKLEDEDDTEEEGAAPPQSIMIENTNARQDQQQTPTATTVFPSSNRQQQHAPPTYSSSTTSSSDIPSSPPTHSTRNQGATTDESHLSDTKSFYKQYHGRTQQHRQQQQQQPHQPQHQPPLPLPQHQHQHQQLSQFQHQQYTNKQSQLPQYNPQRLGNQNYQHQPRFGFRNWNGPWWTGPIMNQQGHRFGLAPKERALWRWVNVQDLDGFLQEIYTYYAGKGMWCIALSRILDLFTVAFVVVFSLFMLSCIDYRIIRQSHSLSEVVVPKCFFRLHGSSLVVFIFLLSFLSWRVYTVWKSVLRLREMHEFFTYLLDIPEDDIQSIPWHEVVNRLSNLRLQHPPAPSLQHIALSADRLDAHDIANRIMREENYLVALFSKELLNLSVPISPSFEPFATRYFPSFFSGSGQLTRVLEWNLRFCLLSYLFGPDGQVRQKFLNERNRPVLIQGLKRRFILMGIVNAVFAPFIIFYSLLYSFLRYFEEYHKNPSSIGSRHYAPLARWKFREYNELPHAFKQRLYSSYPVAKMYMDQFPKEKVTLVARFVAFVSGSIVAVLLLFTIVDPDAFLHFDITPDRTVLFYLGVFTAILATARGLAPQEYATNNPDQLMHDLAQITHYLPDHWLQNGLHSNAVYKEFTALYQLKLVSFMTEMVSVVTTPFVLWYTLPECSPAIIDFFRECTVHVNGLGYACSFAIFDFKQIATDENNNNTNNNDADDNRDDNKGKKKRVDSPKTQQQQDTHQRHGQHIGSNQEASRWESSEGKMEKSLLTFKSQHPDWLPQNQTTSLFLSRMTTSGGHPGGTSLSQSPYRKSNANFGKSSRLFGANSTAPPVPTSSHAHAHAPASAHVQSSHVYGITQPVTNINNYTNNNNGLNDPNTSRYRLGSARSALRGQQQHYLPSRQQRRRDIIFEDEDNYDATFDLQHQQQQQQQQRQPSQHHHLSSTEATSGNIGVTTSESMTDDPDDPENIFDNNNSNENDVNESTSRRRRHGVMDMLANAYETGPRF